jgi:predicted glycosyltransferase
MTNSNARLLFIPVSGPMGMGEYARSVAIATAMVQRSPGVEVHFALSRAAPYAATTPFATTLLPSSPTFHPREVSALIREFQPRVVVFDNAGRTQQLRAARAAGARVVFVSSRRRQRRKAFRLRWLTLIDEHWIAYPQFIAGPLTPLERLKLRLAASPRIRYVDTLLPLADAALAADTLARFGLKSRDYVLVVPGGGTAHPGAENAPAIVAAAARAIAARGYPTLLVGSSAGDAPDPPLLQRLPLLPLAQLCELIRAARLVICNGGDTLLQVLACERPCVAVPIAHDQAHRVDCCARAGLALPAQLDSQAIASAAIGLLERESGPVAGVHPGELRVRNCLEEVLSALSALAS